MKKEIKNIVTATMMVVGIAMFGSTTVHAAELNKAPAAALEFPSSITKIEQLMELSEVRSEKETLVEEINVKVLESSQEIKEVPLLNQGDYRTPYGRYGTVASHGCGITSIAMVCSYMQDEMVSPAELAKQFGNYNTPNGSVWTLFEDSAEELGLTYKGQTGSWEKAEKALKNGQLVISSQAPGLFTGSGHFIVLTGINEDGKVMVNDPNGKNYTKNDTMRKGFKNGFTVSQVDRTSKQYFIYGLKPELKAERELISMMDDLKEISIKELELSIGFQIDVDSLKKAQ